MNDDSSIELDILCSSSSAADDDDALSTSKGETIILPNREPKQQYQIGQITTCLKSFALILVPRIKLAPFYLEWIVAIKESEEARK